VQTVQLSHPRNRTVVTLILSDSVVLLTVELVMFAVTSRIVFVDNRLAVESGGNVLVLGRDLLLARRTLLPKRRRGSFPLCGRGLYGQK